MNCCDPILQSDEEAAFWAKEEEKLEAAMPKCPKCGKPDRWAHECNG